MANLELGTAAIGYDGPNLESSASGIHWGAILGGAVAAAALTLILIPLGSALGFSSFSVFTATANSAIVFTAGWAIWLIITQWASSFIGGYIAGRLRVKWADTHSDEVFFRDTAHGLLAWATATLFTFSLIAIVAFSGANAGTQVVSSDDRVDYYADALYRGATTPSTDAASETARIVASDLVNGGVGPEDKAYLVHQVQTRTGVSQPEAEARVNTMIAGVTDATHKAEQAAEVARKAAVGFFTALFISLLVGAFISCVSAALGGRLRDKY